MFPRILSSLQAERPKTSLAARSITAADALGRAVVVLSSTVGSNAVGNRLRTTVAPIVTYP